MSNKFEIKAGMRVVIEMETPYTNETGDALHKISLGSHVEEVIDAETIIIQMPMYKSYYFPLPRRREVLAFVFTPKRMASVNLLFVESFKQDGLEYAKVRCTSAPEPIHRRDCFRLECNLPIRVVRLSMDEDVAPVETDSYLINISDGGLSFSSDDFFHQEDVLVITIDFGDKTETIGAEIVRIENVGGTGGVRKRRIFGKFMHKTNRQKESLFKHIVEAERKIISSQMRDI